MSQTITAYAPATIANVSVGFDILGLAISPIEQGYLGDRVSVKKAVNSTSLEVIGEYAQHVPKLAHKNLVYMAWQFYCKKIQDEFPVHIILEKNMPISSGLGSSASSIVAALVAINELAGNKLDSYQMLELMGELEGSIAKGIHYDNVAACYLGGTQLISNQPAQIAVDIPSFTNWYWTIAYPSIEVSTAEARALLPTSYARSDCVTYGQNLSGFIRACYLGDDKQAAYFMQDVIAEPYRKKLLPDYDNSKAYLLDNEALAVGISGSGPSIFAVSDNLEVAKHHATWLQNNYVKNHIGFVRVCQTDMLGARIVENII